MKILFSITVSLFSLSTLAQVRTISGTVKNTKNNPIGFINIVVSTAASPSKVLTYCMANEQGDFSFSIKADVLIINVLATAIGHKELNKIILIDTIKVLNLFMETDDKILEGVIVKSENQGDTIKLQTDSMKLTGESTLREILNKTEGVIVTKDGSISYNGKQITKVLINKKEVFVNQNKIALDNLNYEIMDNVQIINNYKDQFNIGFNNAATPVINIKTKAEFKGVFKLRAELGLGYKEAYKIKAKAFFFSDNINMFLLSNTNNIAEKELSFKDVGSPFIQNSSNFFTGLMLPFFLTDDLLKKDLNSNNSLTLRKQTAKSKVGGIFTFAHLNAERNEVTTISLLDKLVRKENYTSQAAGNLFTAALNYSYLFTKKTVLNNSTVIGYIAKNNNSQNNAINFYPNIISTEINSSKPNAYAITNNFKITSLLTNKLLTNIVANYFTEQSKNDFQTNLITTNSFYNHQLQKSNKQVATLSSDIQYKYNDLLSIKAGIFYKLNHEKGRIDFINNSNHFKHIDRTLKSYGALLEINGQTKKFEYGISVTPMFWEIKNNTIKNKNHINTNSVVTYNFNSSDNISAKYQRNLSQYDLNSCYDTIVQSYNFKILNSPANKYNIAVSNNFDIGYHYSNIARSISYFINYNYLSDKNFIQSIFDTAINNIFYFSNKNLENKKTNTINLGGQKGFYIAPKYHKLTFKTNLSYTSGLFSTNANYQTQNYNNKSLQGSFEIWFEPQSFFIKEIKIGTNISQQNLFLNNASINKQTIVNNFLALSSNQKNVEWKITFENDFFKTATNKFWTPNCNLQFRYKKTEKLSFSLAGKSLLNLFKISSNNNAAINNLYNGNLITQKVYTNRIGYLIFNVIYKF